MLRILLATIGFAALAVVSAPYVFAAATESAPSLGEQRCRGTIGEARVHCVETLTTWEA
jgi:Spy/CpxP family protein refolding chaperone